MKAIKPKPIYQTFANKSNQNSVWRTLPDGSTWVGSSLYFWSESCMTAQELINQAKCGSNVILSERQAKKKYPSLFVKQLKPTNI